MTFDEIIQLIKSREDYKEILLELVDNAIDFGLAADADEFDRVSHELYSLEMAGIETNSASDRLHEAICENRRDDAIEILNQLTGERFRPVREQHNLFPERVSA